MVTPLRDDETAVLEHVLRYRLTTAQILASAGVLESSSKDAAKRMLGRLQTEALLQTSPLVLGHDDPAYYHLTEKAALALGKEPTVAAPLKHDMRIESFATAIFCCCGDRPRELFTTDEFKTRFADLWFPGQPIRYYLEQGDDKTVRLAYIKVDTGGPGRWDRLIDSCARFLKQRTAPETVAPAFRKHIAAYAEMVRQERLQITVLTALPDKKRAMELEIERRKMSGQAVPPIRAYVVPELLEVIHPRPPGGLT